MKATRTTRATIRILPFSGSRANLSPGRGFMIFLGVMFTISRLCAEGVGVGVIQDLGHQCFQHTTSHFGG
jgi:hypothetical protein